MFVTGQSVYVCLRLKNIVQDSLAIRSRVHVTARPSLRTDYEPRILPNCHTDLSTI